MFLQNNALENVMLKIKKKDYIQERKNNFYLDEEFSGGFNSGGGVFSTSDKLWRGKTKSFLAKTRPEENFYIKEVMKKYQTNQDELNGYNYKYVLELSDLLGQKDKGFSKKRLELYNNRIENDKKQYSKTNKKFIKYQIAYKPKKQANYFMDFFGSKKKNNYFSNNKKNIQTTFNNTLYNSNDKSIKNKESEIHYRTAYNNNYTPSGFVLNDKTTKKFQLSSEKKFNNAICELTNKKNDNEEQSFDTTSLIGKEDFLANGDKERYHEYLSKEYNFFNQAKLRQMKYLFDKQKRIKLFKKLPNAKFLNYKKENPLRLELFNKINREKANFANQFEFSVDKKLHAKNKINNIGKKTKNKFNKDYQSILIKLKKNLGIE